MSTMNDPSTYPEWTLGWRIRRAIEHGGLSVEALAEKLDVSRSTVSRWSNDHGAPPKRLYLSAIAQICHVDPDWLAHGVVPQGPDGPAGLGSDPSSCTSHDGADLLKFPVRQPKDTAKAA